MDKRYDRIRVLFVKLGDTWRIGTAMGEGEYDAGEEFPDFHYVGADDFIERWLLVPTDWIQSYLRPLDISSAPGTRLLVSDQDEG